jgi:uncharacterized protein (DUF983 family)
MGDKSVWTGLKRGLACRCPACGRGELFRAFLKPKAQCEICGSDNTVYPADDFPPYLTIIIVGHVMVPLLLWVDWTFNPPMVLEASIWVVLATLACLWLLPRMKGVAVGLCWANGILREPVIG